MSVKYILALDQGTTSSRSIVFDERGVAVAMAQQEFTQYFPKAGWVEHDAEEIWASQYKTAVDAIAKAGISARQIAAIGITNQRETTVVWNRSTGKPVHHAIVWQDRRTASICDDLKSRGLEEHIRNATGLVADAYFSGTKVNWILNNVEGARDLAEKGDLAFGTVDSWLMWNLSGGKAHVTDQSNASRTLLFNIRTVSWDEKMLRELDIPASMLPEVRNSSGHFTDSESSLFDGMSIPVTGVAGDQQAALFGQACFEPGSAKNTYGTGCFMLMNTGNQPVTSENGLLTTIAWGKNGETTYALEGSIFVAGAAIQWLRDSMKIIDSAAESEALAKSVEDTHGVYVVPAFTGLGAPYWDMYARGTILGLTRGATRAHIVRATLESLAYQTKDVLGAMQADSKIKLSALKVDGGAAANNFLMQFQSDMLGVSVERPAYLETTAMGAAYLAGIAVGVYSEEQILENRGVDQLFHSSIEPQSRDELYRNWLRAVDRSRNWVEE